MSSTILMRGIPFDAQETYNSNTGETEYDRVAYSADVADWFDTMFSTGIVIPGGGTFTTELKVESQSGMHVKINPGRAVINGRLGYIEEAQVLDLDDPSTSNRIDRIVVELNLTERNFYVKVLKGTPSSSPVAVAPTKTDTIYQLVLADVLVTANVSGTANITDQRNNAELCGISNVRVGVYIPPSDSSENIEVSGDTSDELGGATNVNEALNNVYQIGDIRCTMRKNLSDKWLKCNGDVIAKTDYPDMGEVSETFTNYVGVTTLTAEKMPSDLTFTGSGFSSSTVDSYTNCKIINAFAYGTNGLGILVAWHKTATNTTLTDGTSAVIMLYYSNNVQHPINSLDDLDHSNTIFHNVYRYNIKARWFNNKFLIWTPTYNYSSGDGDLGTIHSVSGSSLSPTTTFTKTPLTNYFPYNDDAESYCDFLDMVYVGGSYKFVFMEYDSYDYAVRIKTIALSNLTSSTNTSSNVKSKVLTNRTAHVVHHVCVVGTTFFIFYRSDGYYSSFYEITIDVSNTYPSELNTMIGYSGSGTLDAAYYPLLSTNPLEKYVCIVFGSDSATRYSRLFKMTETAMYMLVESGWRSITSIESDGGFEAKFEISDYLYDNNEILGGLVDGDDFILFYDYGYSVKESELASKVNKNWMDNLPITCAVQSSIRYMSFDECLIEDSDGNRYSISGDMDHRGGNTYSNKYKNYDNSIKLPELIGDDVSAYYVKVKN